MRDKLKMLFDWDLTTAFMILHDTRQRVGSAHTIGENLGKTLTKRRAGNLKIIAGSYVSLKEASKEAVFGRSYKSWFQRYSSEIPLLADELTGCWGPSLVRSRPPLLSTDFAQSARNNLRPGASSAHTDRSSSSGRRQARLRAAKEGVRGPGEGSCGPTGASVPESSPSSPAPKDVMNCGPERGGVGEPEWEEPEEEAEESTPSKGLWRKTREASTAFKSKTIYIIDWLFISTHAYTLHIDNIPRHNINAMRTSH